MLFQSINLSWHKVFWKTVQKRQADEITEMTGTDIFLIGLEKHDLFDGNKMQAGGSSRADVAACGKFLIAPDRAIDFGLAGATCVL